MPLDYLSELKESCAIAKSRSLTVTRATKITEWKSALRIQEAEMKSHETMKFHSKLLCCINQLPT